MKKIERTIKNFIFLILLSAVIVSGCFAKTVYSDDDPYISVNETFVAGNGSTYQLIMYGLKQSNKEIVIDELIKSFDPDSIEPLKITDDSLPDCEKYNNEDNGPAWLSYDSAKCWAASASNMLWISGWANNAVNPDTGNCFASEDEVFDFYCDSFSNGGGDIASAIDWFIMGEYYLMSYSSGNASCINDGHNGFIPEFLSSFVHEHSDLVAEPAAIEELMKCDWDNQSPRVFQASIGELFSGELFKSEHSLTCVGIIADPEAQSFKDMYKAILLIDSDNDAYPYASDPEDPSVEEMKALRKERPDSVTVYNLRLNSDIKGTPYWNIIEPKASEYADEKALYSINGFPLYSPDLIEKFTEAEGTRDSENHVDMTLESLFTTAEEEAIRSMYGKDRAALTKTVFRQGEAVNLNYFVANRSKVAFDDNYAYGNRLKTSWKVIRESDQLTIASGDDVADRPIIGSEMGFMIHLNEDDGEYLSWQPGEYTVYLDVNKDRSVTEAYYLNNEIRSFSFTIEETKADPEPEREPVPEPEREEKEEEKSGAYVIPMTGIEQDQRCNNKRMGQ